MLLKWLAAAVILYLLLFWMAGRAVYHPWKFPNGFWEQQTRIGAEDVWLHAADGVKLHGWWVPVEKARLATLFLHGNAGNITMRVRHARPITEAASAVLLLEYRGYGKSDGSPSERGLYADADAGYDFLRERGFRPEQIVVHGESLGASVAVDLASRRPCAGVILEAPFPSAGHVAATLLPFIGHWLIFSFNSLQKMARIEAPVLVIHGDRDSIIPHRLGRMVHAAARDPKEMWTVPGGDHNDLVEAAGPEYPKRLAAFYASLSPQSR